MTDTPSPSNLPLAIDELDRAIVNLSTRINTATYELLVLIRQFDERAGWLKWGFLNCAEWLHWRCDLSLGAAREKVRVAHSLKLRPDGRAVPECGYHPEDMQDDCVRDSAESYLIGVENCQPHSQSEPVVGRMLM